MSVMFPLQLKFIEGNTNSLLLEVEGSLEFLDGGPYMLTVSRGRKPAAHSKEQWEKVQMCCTVWVLLQYIHSGTVHLSPTPLYTLKGNDVWNGHAHACMDTHQLLHIQASTEASGVGDVWAILSDPRGLATALFDRAGQLLSNHITRDTDWSVRHFDREGLRQF